ncbi:hypothetical protein ACFW84_18605, partial [Streptomyces anulatus]|uniref:hypothetical protein n=1 Tax=Streptomyces anulatus TaxID=1892 RepID=UPI00367DE6AD
MKTPKGKATPQATGNQIRTGNGTDKESGKVGTAGKGKRESEEPGKHPASTGNRTRKSLIESETQDSKTKKKTK